MLKDLKVDVDATNDLLGQHAAINTLVNAIERLPPPACIALYGAWGSGKTNILHNAEKRVTDDLHVPVWFDPWEYDQQPELIGPLLRALLLKARSYRSLDVAAWEAVKGKTRRFYRAAKTVVGRIAARRVINALPLDALEFDMFSDEEAPGRDEGALQCLPEDEATDATEAQEDIAASGDMGAIERWLDDASTPQDAVAATKKRFAELVTATLALARKGGNPKPDRRVVFFLDDLDRCLPDRVVELVEQVKLLLCGSDECQAIFVFALDRRIVGEAIKNRFPGASQYTGENYLEKIFDFSMETPPLPQQTHAVRAFAEACLSDKKRQIDGAERLKRLTQLFGNAEPLMDALSVAPLANPRVIKRTLNRLDLLVSGLSMEQKSELANIGDAGVYERCLLWLAGAERYRTVRQFFRESEFEEVRATIHSIKTNGSRSGLSTEAFDVTHLPGIRVYFKALDPLSKRFRFVSLTAFSDPEVEAPIGSLKWFDDLMRSAGL